jgi:hypothetical protein
MCAALRTLDHLQPEKRPYPQLAAVIVRLYCSIGKNDFVTNISCWHAVKRDRCRKQSSRNKIIPDAETALDRRTKASRWGDDPNGNQRGGGRF